MKHFVYKTTNLVNGKYYIGKRSAPTLSGTYLGSGTALKAALKKYGQENFKREILKEFESAEEAYTYEAELVGKKEVLDRNCYNLDIGGRAFKGSRLNKPNSRSKPITVYGITYPTLAEACRTLNMGHGRVKRISLGIPKKPVGQAKAISCIIDGVTYSSYREASRQLGVCHHTAKKLSEQQNPKCQT